MIDNISVGVSIVGVLASLFAGIFIFSQNKRNFLGYLFLVLSIGVAVLTIANYLSVYGPTAAVQLWNIRLVMMMATLIVFPVYILLRYVEAQEVRLLPHEKFLLVVTVLVLPLQLTGVFISGEVSSNGSIAPAPGPGVALFIGHFVAMLVLSIVRLVRGAMASPRGQRSKYKVLIIGLIPAVVLAPVTSMVLPIVYGYTALIPLSPLYVVFFLLCLGYATIRHRLFDVRLAVVRSAGYVLTIGIMAVAYVVFAYIASQVLFRDSSSEGVGFGPVNVILALVLALAFQPIKRFFDQLTNKIFYRGDYDRDTFFRELGKILSYDTDLRLLLKQASSYIASSMGVERVFFHITGRGVYHGAGPRKRQLPDEDIATIAKYYRDVHEFPEAIVADSVESEEVKRVLASHQSSVVLPLILQGEAIGYLFLGEHKGRGYTVRDIRALESVANELTIAVRNSLSVEEVRELNETLQRRIDDATKELRTSNQQLQRLDEAKDEFISMASHQLRTPLTSIKGYLDMVLQGDLGRVSATQKAVLSEAFISSERMVTLINDFLNVSRLQTGKFVIERRESDLAEAMKGQLQMLDIVAKQHRLTLKHKIGKDVPLVQVDIDKIRQVMLNMIDNAIFYSKLGTSVQISLLKEGDDIVFKVKDTGIGVPESEQVGLFGKFFRATNARRKRPDGTGIGLFLAKKVILAHGGEMIFESKEGRGSTFGFRLPIS